MDDATLNPGPACLERASIIRAAGGLDQAIASGALPPAIDTTLSEALLLGLLRQGVERFVAVLGHGSTELGEVLRVYQSQGIVQVFHVRNEIEASHAATALRWVRGEKAAVVTSIGPGALQAFAASLVPASNEIGVWYLFGDETTHDEGPNMQQIPGTRQASFLRTFGEMGGAYTLHTPESIGTALLRGLNCVDASHGAGPFFLLLPLNTQPAPLRSLNLDELPVGTPPEKGAAYGRTAYARAVDAIQSSERIVLKLGAGALNAGSQIVRLMEAIDAVAVLSPRTTGLVPYAHPQNMLVGGSKGTICGNFATDEADLLIAIGTRAVCQSDSSRTAYPNVRHIININADPIDAMHYARTTPLVGDVSRTLERLLELLQGRTAQHPERRRAWLETCLVKKREWETFKRERYEHPTLFDPMWDVQVLTQPAAIQVAADWAREADVISFFDAGDVQANGFQVAEDNRPGQTVTETGASYMGFAVSALLSTAMTEKPFYGLAITGDGSFMMNPQILIDGVHHSVSGCILLLDNRRMAAISALQVAQYGREFATSDDVEIDYVKLASSVKGIRALEGGHTPESLRDALDEAGRYRGLSLIHVPVYYGDHPLGGLGAYGRWNVGNWVGETQALRHRIGL